MAADVTIVGTGIIGLTSALEVADRGVRVRLVGTAHRGEASSAAAGMLAPSVEVELRDEAPRAFALASRERYPAYLTALETRSAIPVPLNRLGILEVASDTVTAERLDKTAPKSAERLSSHDIATLEPALQGTAVSGLLHPHDGCVDTLLLLDALRLVVARHAAIEVITEDVCELRIADGKCEVLTNQENWYAAETVVLAAGAWTPAIGALPRPISIVPVRGQMVSFGSAALRHVVFGTEGYLVPKADGTTMAGSTMESVGFAPETTDHGIEHVRRAGVALCPALGEAPVLSAWAGLRPVTPDRLPLLGRDPEHPNVIYACGHSRNGILLAPLTGEVVADLVSGAPPRYAIERFRPDRF